MASADGEFGDAVDDRHQDDGKEGGDVKDHQLLAERPAEGDEQENEEGEEDVAANVAAGVFGVVRIRGGGLRGQGVLLIRNGILPRMGPGRGDSMDGLDWFDADLGGAHDDGKGATAKRSNGRAWLG